MRASSPRAERLFILLSLVGMAELVWTTRTGPGVSPDSVQYIYSACTFAEGRGFLSLYDDAGQGAATHYPPGYPVALAVAAFFTPDGSLTAAGTVLGILLRGINLFLIMWLLLRYTGRLLLPLIVGFFLINCLQLLRIHEMIWSEPLFFLLSLLALWKIVEYCDDGSRRDLAIAIICTALAAITRYIGMVLICSVTWVVLVRSSGSFTERFRRAALTGILSALPLLVWFVRGKLVADSMTNRDLGYHPMTADYWNELLVTLGEFFLQVLQLEEQSRIAGLALGLLAVVLALRYRKALITALRANTFAFALLCCNVGYLLLLIISNTFLDDTPLYYRIICPVLVQLLIAVVLLVDRWAAQRTWSPRARKRCLLALSVYGALHVFDHVRYVLDKKSPEGYFSSSWMADPVVARIKKHPTSALCSNAIDALYVHTGRILPELGSLDTAATGTFVAVFAEGAFNNGRAFGEDLSATNPYAPAVRMELVLESPVSKLYRVR